MPNNEIYTEPPHPVRLALQSFYTDFTTINLKKKKMKTQQVCDGNRKKKALSSSNKMNCKLSPRYANEGVFTTTRETNNTPSKK